MSNYVLSSRLKSLSRSIYNGCAWYDSKEKLLKFAIDELGYRKHGLSKDKKLKTHMVHKLVAIAFLGHAPCGYEKVINHIDKNPANNHVSNLEIVTSRYNSSCHRTGVSSKYTGVSWDKTKNKWASHIIIKKQQHHLGRYHIEEEAKAAYDTALSNYEKLGIIPDRRKRKQPKPNPNNLSKYFLYKKPKPQESAQK